MACAGRCFFFFGGGGESQTFCDVLARGGAVGMAGDAVKMVVCRADDGRVSAADMSSGQVCCVGGGVEGGEGVGVGV